MMSTNIYTRIKAKCLDCSLHFVVCTWTPERHRAESLYCPECGQHQGHFILWKEEVNGAILEEVPGNATLLSATQP